MDTPRAVILALVVLVMGWAALRVVNLWPLGVSATEVDEVQERALLHKNPVSQGTAVSQETDLQPSKAASMESSLGGRQQTPASASPDSPEALGAPENIDLTPETIMLDAAGNEAARSLAAAAAELGLPGSNGDAVEARVDWSRESAELTQGELQKSSSNPKSAATIPVAAPSLETRSKVRSPSPSASRALRKVDLREAGGALEIRFLSSGKVSGYRSFSVQRPRRFVVDLAGDWQVLVPATHRLGHHLANQVRIGKHPDKLRVVTDLGPDAGDDVRLRLIPEGFIVDISPAPLSPLPP